MGFTAVHTWAHAFAQGRLVATGGGGYEWVDVVPRAWTHLVAEVLGAPIDPTTEVPEEYRLFVQESMGRSGPSRMTDGQTPWPRALEQGWDPGDPVDAAIRAVRDAVYPHHGLDPDPEGW
jgi:acetoin utilization protein AcuC